MARSPSSMGDGNESCIHKVYQDLRSLNRASNRHKRAKQKYYGYLSVKGSWVGKEYVHHPQLVPGYHRRYDNALFEHVDGAEIRTFTKKDMFENKEFAIWPLDFRHHYGRAVRERYSWPMRRHKVIVRNLRDAIEEEYFLFGQIEQDREDVKILARLGMATDENHSWDQYEAEECGFLVSSDYSSEFDFQASGFQNGILSRRASATEKGFDMLDDLASDAGYSEDGWDLVPTNTSC